MKKISLLLIGCIMMAFSSLIMAAYLIIADTFSSCNTSYSVWLTTSPESTNTPMVWKLKLDDNNKVIGYGIKLRNSSHDITITDGALNQGVLKFNAVYNPGDKPITTILTAMNDHEFASNDQSYKGGRLLFIGCAKY